MPGRPPRDNDPSWPESRRLQAGRIFFQAYKGVSPAELAHLVSQTGAEKVAESTIRRDRDGCFDTLEPVAPSTRSIKAYMILLGHPEGFDFENVNSLGKLIALNQTIKKKYQEQFPVDIYEDAVFIGELPKYWSRLIVRIEEEQWTSVVDIIETELERDGSDAEKKGLSHYLFFYLGLAENKLGNPQVGFKHFKEARLIARAKNASSHFLSDVNLHCGLTASDCGEIDEAAEFAHEALDCLSNRPIAYVNMLVLATKQHSTFYGMIIGSLVERLRMLNDFDWAEFRDLIERDAELQHFFSDPVFAMVLALVKERIGG